LRRRSGQVQALSGEQAEPGREAAGGPALPAHAGDHAALRLHPVGNGSAEEGLLSARAAAAAAAPCPPSGGASPSGGAVRGTGAKYRHCTIVGVIKMPSETVLLPATMLMLSPVPPLTVAPLVAKASQTEKNTSP